MRAGKLDTWATGFPWDVIIPYIDNESFEWMMNAAARENFESKTRLNWDNLSDVAYTKIQCPSCKRHCKVPWTEWDRPEAWKKSYIRGQDLVGESTARGFADSHFQHRCDCQYTFSHRKMQVQKFRHDFLALCDHDIPMQGTVLDSTGRLLVEEVLAY